jgi:hypothetical protein
MWSGANCTGCSDKAAMVAVAYTAMPDPCDGEEAWDEFAAAHVREDRGECPLVRLWYKRSGAAWAQGLSAPEVCE